VRLSEIRLTAIEERTEIMLMLGRASAAADELAALVREYPLREGTVALAGGTVHTPEKGEWLARLPAAILAVMAVNADADALQCRLSAGPDLGVLVLAFAPWPASTVLKCPVTALPAQGQLSVRDVRVTTRMGRTVRYLIPAFTTT
jgi:hypothetical protein